MNIEELTEEYKNKLDELMNEYNNKVKELEGTKEEPFIKEGQEYYYIDGCFRVFYYKYSNNIHDKVFISAGNCYPYTDETKYEVFKEVELIAERRKLQSEMEMFARLNNEEEIDWNDDDQLKWCLYIRHNEIIVDIGVNYCRELNATYFSSVEIAKKALEKFGDRIRKLYIDMEK